MYTTMGSKSSVRSGPIRKDHPDGLGLPYLVESHSFIPFLAVGRKEGIHGSGTTANPDAEQAGGLLGWDLGLGWLGGWMDWLEGLTATVTARLISFGLQARGARGVARGRARVAGTGGGRCARQWGKGRDEGVNEESRDREVIDGRC